MTVTVSGGSGGSGCVVNKIRLKFRNNCCFDRLNGAQIQGSNDGSNWTNIYTINQNGTGSWQKFTFGNSTVYQRVRFVASPTGFGELYELEFYKNNTKLNGMGFGNGAQDASLQFIDVNGGVLVKKNLVGNGTWQQDQTDLSAQADGIYTVQILGEQHKASQKFVIAK